MGQKCSWALVIKPDNFYFVPSVLYCIFDTFPVGWVGGWVGGWLGGWINEDKNSTQPQLKLKLGLG